MAEDSKKPSRWWYLLPIFFSVIGGIIGYFLLKDRDRKFAERLLIIGLVMIVVGWIASIALSFVLYWYIAGSMSSVIKSSTSTLLSITGSTSCAPNNGDITVGIRNDGTEKSGPVTVTVTQPDGSGLTCAIILSISSGLQSGSECTGRTAGSGSYQIKASADGKTARGTVFCAS